jgi:hypothetical protein
MTEPQGTGIGGNTKKTIRTPLPINNFTFNTYASCGLSTQFPIMSAGQLTIPVASDDPSCPFNFLDADGRTTFNISEFSFIGTFTSGATAPSVDDQIAVFATTDIVNFTSQEFGWALTLNNNILWGYVQNGTGLPGGVTYFNGVVIQNPSDGLEHLFTARVISTNGTNTFFWYVDNILINSFNVTLVPNYVNLPYHFVVTTHRTTGGWNSDAFQIVIKKFDFVYNI